MWVVYSPAGEGIRLEKDSQVDPEARYWLRPGKTYTAARSSEGHDFYLTLKKYSRKDGAAFSLAASEVDPATTFVTSEGQQSQHVYGIDIIPRTRSVWISRDGAECVEIQPGTRERIGDLDRVYTWAKDAPSVLVFEWRPVHIYHRMAKKRDIPDLQNEYANLGITFSSGVVAPQPLPSILHTHYLIPKINKEPSVPQLLAALHQLSFVTKDWTSTLDEAAAAVDGRRSRLESDFISNWPAEIDYFPPVDGQDDNSAEREIWQPLPRRARLFERCVFLDFSGDPNIKKLVEAGSGVHMMPSLSDTASFEHDFKTASTAHDIGTSHRVYAILPINGKLDDDRESTVLGEAAPRLQIRGMIDVRDIMTAIVNVEPLPLTGKDIVVKQTEGSIAAAATTAIATQSESSHSAPPESIDVIVAATHPNDIAISAPEQPKPEPQPIEQALPNRLSKKPRRLANRAPIDPFASLFNDIQPVTAPSILARVESLGGPSMNLDPVQPATQASSRDTQEQSQSTAPLRSNSKYAKVRRRVGTENSQFPIIGLPEEPVDPGEPPAKKFKSFDPDVETVTSQVLEKHRAMQKAAEDNQHATTKTALKRKTVDNIEEDVEEQEESPQLIKKKASGAARSASVSDAKVKKTQVADPPSLTQKYLQVNTGKRKVKPLDALLNKEFNELKIARPTASHALGWNERDVIQEEMEENEPWEPDDKATFFQIKFVDFARKERPSVQNSSTDPRYVGRPDFKAFRPKDVNPMPNSTSVRQNRNVELVIQEPLGYGLQEKYDDGHPSAIQDDFDMPLAPTQRKSKTKAPIQPKKSAARRKAVVSESSEDEMDDGEDDMPATTRNADQTTFQGRAKLKETITLDSDSDEDGVRTFGGFQKTQMQRKGTRNL